MGGGSAGRATGSKRARYHYTVRRRLFNLAAAVSLVLCLATAAMWVRSAAHVDDLRYDSAVRQVAGAYQRWALTLITVSGGVQFQVVQVQSPRGVGVADQQGSHFSFVTAPYHRYSIIDFAPAGVTEDVMSGLPAGDFNRVTYGVLPYWLLILPLVPLPLLWGQRGLRMRTRRKLGLCRKCGYDLRATAECCPECGSEAVAGQSIARVPP